MNFFVSIFELKDIKPLFQLIHETLDYLENTKVNSQFEIFIFDVFSNFIHIKWDLNHTNFLGHIIIISQMIHSLTRG